MSTRYKAVREAYGITYRENAAFKDTYGGMEGYVFLESYRVRPQDLESDTVTVFMHPVGGGAYLPIVTELARQGHHVIYCNSRFRGADYALTMEKVVLDLGAAIADAKQRFGYTKVVLGGWSGGGSLSLFYQQQAVRPTVTSTPAGDPPDLTQADLPAADGIMLLAAHPSRHRVLVDCTDAAILDEADPTKRNPDLDLYGDKVKPPYSTDFVAEYRAAQLARNRRITAWVREELAKVGPGEERCFTVHGTMADPRWLDPTLDPNDRVPGMSFLGVPAHVNNGPVGLARFSSLRSWLSQWSVDDANGDGLRAARDLTVPALVINNSADEVITPGYAREMLDAVASEDKTLIQIEGANHYYIGEAMRAKVTESVERCGEWLAARGFSPV